MASRFGRSVAATVITGAATLALGAAPVVAHAAPRDGLDPQTARVLDDYANSVPGGKKANRVPDRACRGTSATYPWAVGPIWTGKVFRKGLVVNRVFGQYDYVGQVIRIDKKTWRIDYKPVTKGDNMVVDILHKKPYGYKGEIYAFGHFAGDFQLHCPKAKSTTTDSRRGATSSDQDGASRGTDSSVSADAVRDRESR